MENGCYPSAMLKCNRRGFFGALAALSVAAKTPTERFAVIRLNPGDARIDYSVFRTGGLPPKPIKRVRTQIDPPASETASR